uniref:MYND-type domain-containing protein n=1 Tax=Mesocestoides corti TaxID=53468 RepID=A0A5K3EPZ5_MESCO
MPLLLKVSHLNSLLVRNFDNILLPQRRHLHSFPPRSCLCFYGTMVFLNWDFGNICSIRQDMDQVTIFSFLSFFFKGDGLKEWGGLIFDSCLVEKTGTDTTWQDFYREENALLRAYASPSDVIMLSVCPRISSEDLRQTQLLTVDLSGWEAFYSWRGLSLSSPLAFLFHWPLTVYYILNKLFPVVYPHQVNHILEKKTLNVHVIGAEAEVDMLPVFKELEFLISPAIEEVVLNLIGPNISPYASGKKWLLSHRMSANIWRGHYHQFVEEFQSGGNFCSPDFVIGFNVGFAAYPSWTKTLELLKAMNVPCFFTDSCQYSCIWDFQVMDAVGLGSGFDTSNPQSAMASLNLNPFRSPVRIRTGGTRWPWFSNAFIFSPCAAEFNEDALAAKLSGVQI